MSCTKYDSFNVYILYNTKHKKNSQYRLEAYNPLKKEWEPIYYESEIINYEKLEHIAQKIIKIKDNKLENIILYSENPKTDSINIVGNKLSKSNLQGITIPLKLNNKKKIKLANLIKGK